METSGGLRRDLIPFSIEKMVLLTREQTERNIGI
jgi:hypothetical protein